jgi:hypothetical protein
MATNIYCGVEKEPPKGKRFGSYAECNHLKQVRRWGLMKQGDEPEKKFTRTDKNIIALQRAKRAYDNLFKELEGDERQGKVIKKGVRHHLKDNLEKMRSAKKEETKEKYKVLVEKYEKLMEKGEEKLLKLQDNEDDARDVVKQQLKKQGMKDKEIRKTISALLD